MTNQPNTADICMYWCNDADIQVGEEGHWKVGRSATIAYLCRRLDEAEKRADIYQNALAFHGYWPICEGCLYQVQHCRCEARARAREKWEGQDARK